MFSWFWHRSSHHIAMRKQLVQRLSGLLYLHGNGDLLLLWQHAVISLYLLDHLHLLLCVSALQELKCDSKQTRFMRQNSFQWVRVRFCLMN